MNLSQVTTTQIGIVIAVLLLLAAALAILFSVRKRRTQHLRTQFGASEYTRAVKEGEPAASRSRAGPAFRTRRPFEYPAAGCLRSRSFVESWARVQARFVDGPGGAVTDADQLLNRRNVYSRLSDERL